jgi:hypothetical protein
MFVVGLLAAGCSDSDPDARLTVDDLEHAPVPSLCDYKGGELENGSLPGIPDLGTVDLNADSASFGDLDGDRSRDAVAAAVVDCYPEGSNERHSTVLVWNHDLEVVGTVPFRETLPQHEGGWPATVNDTAIVDGDLRVDGRDWQAADAHATPSISWSRFFTMSADGTFTRDSADRVGNITVNGLSPLQPDMTFAEAAAAAGWVIGATDPNAHFDDVMASRCVALDVLDNPGVHGIGSEGRLKSLSFVGGPGGDASSETDRGVGGGSHESTVLQAYPRSAVSREPSDLGVVDDLYVAGKSSNRLRFIFGDDHTVTEMRTGQGSWVDETCLI